MTFTDAASEASPLPRTTQAYTLVNVFVLLDFGPFSVVRSISANCDVGLPPGNGSSSSVLR